MGYRQRGTRFLMAIAKVQSGISAQLSGVNPATVTISASGPGNLLVVLPSLEVSTTTVTSITDNAGNTYSQVPNARASEENGSSIWSDIWYAPNTIAGATTVTINFSANATGGRVAVIEYSGVKTSSPIDVSGHVNGSTSTSVVGPALTITNNGSMLVTFSGGATVSSPMVNAPWSDVITQSGYGSIGQYLPGMVGTYSATWTMTDFYVASGVAFLPAASSNVKKWSTELVF
jgi:hypothetical protein